ncbi:MAG: prepilin-type N-terminal cleavage/methylation domain-containing protein [Planctomycetota bacterium]|nr:prepilin-type N-terminal cleavage/methylation domain-containing protein [Planctomycetota bacterium]
MVGEAHPTRAGFTLVELLATMVVVSAVAAVSTGLIYGFSKAYASAAEQRRSVERVSTALDRIVREIREAPASDDVVGGMDLETAESDRIVFGNGVGFELDGSDLVMTNEDGASGPLCRDVERFELRYLGSDGVTDVSGDPAATQRIEIALSAGGVELRTAALLWAATGGGS